MVIKYFIHAFKNTKRIFLRNLKYFRKILILYGWVFMRYNNFLCYYVMLLHKK
jgi:hypothetical protein